MLVGVLLGLFLDALIIFLEPFDTNEYRSEHKLLLLSCFGLIFSICFIGYSFLESLLYKRLQRLWLVWHELVSLLIFMVVSGSVVFLYNHFIINHSSYSLRSHWLYLSRIVAAMTPIIVPLLWFLRQQFGELVTPVPPHFVELTGLNKGEKFRVERDSLCYIKAVENYIEICYLEQDKEISLTFRQTLSEVHQQVPFLVKCHRSFLVNPECIIAINGNSQKAIISLKGIKDSIPLSKTFYKNIKGRFE